jgi:hypothetical protein
VREINRSDDMRQSLSYRDNDVSYGLVSPKASLSGNQAGDRALLFSAAGMQKEVWRPKVTLQWHEPYRAPLTLQ